MLSGNYYLIEKIANDYDEVIMVGISAGGWYISLLSAVIPSVLESYSFSGSFPKAFRLNKKDYGDWEQIDSGIWDRYDYWDFYLLSLYSSDGKRSRKHHLIYNDRDYVCFSNPNAKVVSKIIEDASIDGLDRTILNKALSEIDLFFFRRIGSRRE